MTALNRLLGIVSSLRLTVFCLAAAFVLVFVGTLAQVNHGLYYIQEQYFQSWFIKWSLTPDGFKIPIFPGGHLIGAVLLVNLIAAHIRRFSWTWRKLGIQLTHLGLIIMLAGGLATDLFSVSSYMRLKEGETKNYSEDSDRMELAVIELNAQDGDQVTTVPGARLADGGTLTHESLPFKMVIKGFFRNSDLKMVTQESGNAAPAASNGAGARISIKSMPRATKTDDHDVMSAVLEIIPNNDGKSLGTWLVSAAMAAPQDIEVDGRRWSLQLRAARYYKPYSLSLIDFTHETYPGTQTPKDFSSKVTLTDPTHNETRQVKIYMNHPLRYQGDTYYQSGFEPDNSGTVLQVVRNPGGSATYVACAVMTLGLLFQFLYHLTRFARRAKPVTAP
ncbi:MAG: cytochrome c biogenesis protein ResB [Verrucomicrobiota bacterium]